MINSCKEKDNVWLLQLQNLIWRFRNIRGKSDMDLRALCRNSAEILLYGSHLVTNYRVCTYMRGCLGFMTWPTFALLVTGYFGSRKRAMGRVQRCCLVPPGRWGLLQTCPRFGFFSTSHVECLWVVWLPPVAQRHVVRLTDICTLCVCVCVCWGGVMYIFHAIWWNPYLDTSGKYF